jgi:hypothetical protein
VSSLLAGRRAHVLLLTTSRVTGEHRCTRVVRIGLALLALLTLAGSASAQTVNGAIIGVVKDASGAWSRTWH